MQIYFLSAVRQKSNRSPMEQKPEGLADAKLL